MKSTAEKLSVPAINISLAVRGHRNSAHANKAAAAAVQNSPAKPMPMLREDAPAAEITAAAAIRKNTPRAQIKFLILLPFPFLVLLFLLFFLAFSLFAVIILRYASMNI
jgi:hypothetical protein